MDIKQEYMTKNPCYVKWQGGRKIKPKGIMVHSTASPGLMAQALRDRWDSAGAQVSVHAFIDGEETIQALPWTARAWHAGVAKKGGPTANDTHISFEVCEPWECRLIPIEWAALKRGSKGWAVKRLQQELTARGYDPKGIDGSFGAGCEAAVRKFQADAGLSADGSVGPATRQALAGRMGSYLQYDPRETEGYFAAVWDRAVALCAHLCREYGLDPERDIICHSEGYKQGVASNHADVLHWWPLHGRSMDDFRAAVKDKLAEPHPSPSGTPSPEGEGPHPSRPAAVPPSPSGEGRTVTCPHCGGTVRV